jgi:hypothetical protein
MSVVRRTTVTTLQSIHAMQSGEAATRYARCGRPRELVGLFPASSRFQWRIASGEDITAKTGLFYRVIGEAESADRDGDKGGSKDACHPCRRHGVHPVVEFGADTYSVDYLSAWEISGLSTSVLLWVFTALLNAYFSTLTAWKRQDQGVS